eukprot:8862471-Alexandrium_andersonii.AAC.1
MCNLRVRPRERHGARNCAGSQTCATRRAARKTRVRAPSERKRPLERPRNTCRHTWPSTRSPTQRPGEWQLLRHVHARNPTPCAQDTLSNTRAPRWHHWSDLSMHADMRGPRRAHPRGTD